MRLLLTIKKERGFLMEGLIIFLTVVCVILGSVHITLSIKDNKKRLNVIFKQKDC